MASRFRGECPWCVRVTCQHPHKTEGINPIIWLCKWSGYRAHANAQNRCPWCGRSGEFKVTPVFHRLGTICTFRRFARGERPT